jgi:hypothetical protein
MVRIKRTSSAVPKDIDGHRLVPVAKSMDGWPRLQDGVLPQTYYRVNDAGELVSMVTVMPDGLRAAWASCAKCHDHFLLCQCRSGLYHPSSIGWMRATYDHPDWPNVRLTDYSTYFDPWGRRKGKAYDRTEVKAWALPVSTPKPVSPRVQARKQQQKVERDTRDQIGGLTVQQIESIDMAEVQKIAEAQAAAATKKVRRIIRRKAK